MRAQLFKLWSRHSRNKGIHLQKLYVLFVLILSPKANKYISRIMNELCMAARDSVKRWFSFCWFSVGTRGNMKKDIRKAENCWGLMGWLHLSQIEHKLSLSLSVSLTEQTYPDDEHYSMFIIHTGKKVTIADEKLYHDKKKLQSSLIFVTQYHRCSHESYAEAWLKIVLWYFTKFVGWTDPAVSVLLPSLASCLRETLTPAASNNKKWNLSQQTTDHWRQTSSAL